MQIAFDNSGDVVPGKVNVDFTDLWYDWVSDADHDRGIGYGEWPEFVVRDPSQLKYAMVIKYERITSQNYSSSSSESDSDFWDAKNVTEDRPTPLNSRLQG